MLKFVAPPGSFLRPLTKEELRLLNGALSWRKRRVQQMPKRLLQAISLVGGLWLLALIAIIAYNRSNWLIVTALWMVAAAAIVLWSLPDLRKQAHKEREQLRMFEDAFNRNQAVVFRIASEQMVEFEEEEDEGACYAFQVADDRIVFVSGQDFYPSARFPNSDFSLVHVLNEDGYLLEMFVTKQGRKLKPLRRISAKTKSELNLPDHLDTIHGRLQDLEQLLAAQDK